MNSLDSGSFEEHAVDDLDNEMLIKIAELREHHADQMNTDACWEKIAEQLGVDKQSCKSKFYKAISRFKGQHSEENLQLCKMMSRANIDFDYCFENFTDLCRFCCRLKCDVPGVREIFDDSSEDAINETIKLTNKIHFTLFNDNLETVELKLSNLICESCSHKIDEFFTFKKECNRNAQVLLEVKNELDRMQNNAATIEDLIDASKAIDHLKSEDEILSQHSDEEIEELEDSEDENSQISSASIEVPPEETLKKSKTRKASRLEVKERKSYKGKNSQCPICGKLVKGIQMHMLIHTGERRHKCSYCSKTFTQSGQLKRHINSHLNIRNYKCPEPGCDRTFVDPSSVTKHLVVHNKEDRKYQCSLCGSRFNRLGALRYHEKTHRQERSHTCEICNKSFLAKYDLTKHMRIHTGEKPYSCKYCDKRFSISKNAKVHLRVHTKEKPYSCNYCDLSFAYRSSMKSHLVKIHNQVDILTLPSVTEISISIKDSTDQSDLIVEGANLELHPHFETFHQPVNDLN